MTMKFADPINEPPEAQEIRGRMIRQAERLKEFLTMSVISKDAVAREVLGIFKSGLLYCGESFRKLLMDWLLEKGSQNCSPCNECESFKKNRFSDCRSCKKESAFPDIAN
jgi:hypothetical protein